MKTAPTEVTNDLVRDAKSAANTVIKQAMRRYIRDMFYPQRRILRRSTGTQGKRPG